MQAAFEIEKISKQCEKKLTVAQKNFISEVIDNTSSFNISDILDNIKPYASKKYLSNSRADVFLKKMGFYDRDIAAVMIDQFIFESYRRNFDNYFDNEKI